MVAQGGVAGSSAIGKWSRVYRRYELWLKQGLWQRTTLLMLFLGAALAHAPLRGAPNRASCDTHPRDGSRPQRATRHDATA
jgi:hypothetical protein